MSESRRKAKVNVTAAKDALESGVIVFADAQDENKKLTVNLDDVPENMQKQVMLHGLIQKLRDSYAGNVEDPIDTATAVWERITAGEWVLRSADAESSSAIQRLADAVVAAYKTTQGVDVDREKVLESLNGMNRAARNVVRKNPDVKLELAKAEQAKAAETAKSIGDLVPIG